MEEYIAFAQRNTLIVIGFIAVLGLILWVEFNRLTRKHKTLNVNEAVRLLNDDKTICLDVREEKELKDGIIKHSRHIPLRQLSEKLAEYENAKDKPFLVYCKTGNRSSHACSVLTKHGFTDVSHLVGGMAAWETANLPLERKS